MPPALGQNRLASFVPVAASQCRRRASLSDLRRSAFICGLVLLTGCSYVSGQRGDVKVTSLRFLWKSENISFAVADTNFNATLAIGKSRSDEESIRLAAEAAVKAAVKSTLPIP